MSRAPGWVTDYATTYVTTYATDVGTFELAELLLQDFFVTPHGPPLPTPRDCEPGPGQLTLLTLNNSAFSIDGNQRLQLTPPSPVTTHNDHTFGSVEGFARKAGLIFQYEALALLGYRGGVFNGTPAQNVNVENSLWYATDRWRYLTAAGFADVTTAGSTTANSRQSVSICVRTVGAFHILQNLEYSVPTLLWVDNVSLSGTLYLGFQNFESTSWVDNVIVADTNYFVRPLVNDGFYDVDATPLQSHLTDGQAVPEEGGSGLSWLELFGSFNIDLNTARSLGTAEGDQRYLAAVNANSSNVILEGSVFQPSGWGQTAGFIVRCSSDGSIFYYSSVEPTDNYLRISEYDGNFTLRAEISVTLNYDQYYLITATADDTEIQAYVDGGSRLVYASATVGQTNTYVGLRCWNQNARFNNFAIWPRRLTDFPVLPKGADPAITYELNDGYDTPTLPQFLVTPRYAEPGPGIETLVTNDGQLYINDNSRLQFTAQSTPSWGDLQTQFDSLTTGAGVIVSADVRFEESATFGPQLTAAGIIGVYFSATDIQQDQVKIGDCSPGNNYNANIIFRSTTGFFTTIEGGEYSERTLLFVHQSQIYTGTQATLRTFSRICQTDNFQIPDAKYTPTPITSDSFDRADGPLAGTFTDNAAVEEGGANVLEWVDLFGSHQIISNQITYLSAGGGGGDPEVITVVDANEVDGLIQITINCGTDPIGNLGTLARWKDLISYGYYFFVARSVSNYRILEWNGVNNWIQRASSSIIIVDNTDYNLLATLDGQEIQCYFDYTTQIEYSSASSDADHTKWGVRITQFNTRADNFIIWPRTITDFPNLSKSPDPETTWLFFDRFIVDRASPLPTPRLAEFGPGSVTLTQTNGTMQTLGGKLLIANPGGDWNEQVYDTNQYSLDAGRMLIISIKKSAPNVSGPSLGFDPSVRSYINFAPDNFLRVATPTATKVETFGVYEFGTEYVITQIMRTMGTHFIVEGGTYLTPTLLCVNNEGTAPSSFFRINNFQAEVQFSYVGIPEQTWTPTPILSDSFDRADGSPGNNDNQGAEEGGLLITNWLDFGVASHIVSNTLQSVTSEIAIPCLQTFVSDCLVQGTVRLGQGNGLTFRSNNGGTERMLSQLDFVNDWFTLYEFADDISTNRGRVTVTLSSGTDYNLLATMDGDEVQIYLDNSNRVAYSSAGFRGTYHGFYIGGGWGDNFVVWPRQLTDFPEITIPTLYELNDQFIVDASIPDTTVRTCEQGPGQLTFTVQGTNAAADVVNGELVLMYPSPSASTCGWNGNVTVRESGVCLLQEWRHQDNAGWTYGSAWGVVAGNFSLNDHLIGQEGTVRVFAASGGTGVEVADADLEYHRYVISLRGTGAHYLRDDVLLWVTNVSSTTNVYPRSFVHSRRLYNRRVEIPQERWTPIPIVSDGFGGPNGTLLSDWFTDGQGAEEGQQQSVRWQVFNSDANILLQNNRVQFTINANDICGVQCNLKDVLVECIVNIAAANRYVGPTVRITDDQNWIAYRIQSGAEFVEILEYVEGSFTSRATASFTPTYGTDYHLLAVVDDAFIAGYIDYGTRISYASIDGKLTSSIHGYHSQGNAVCTSDNFVVWERRPSNIPAVLRT